MPEISSASIETLLQIQGRTASSRDLPGSQHSYFPGPTNADMSPARSSRREATYESHGRVRICLIEETSAACPGGGGLFGW